MFVAPGFTGCVKMPFTLLFNLIAYFGSYYFSEIQFFRISCPLIFSVVNEEKDGFRAIFQAIPQLYLVI